MTHLVTRIFSPALLRATSQRNNQTDIDDEQDSVNDH